MSRKGDVSTDADAQDIPDFPQTKEQPMYLVQHPELEAQLKEVMARPEFAKICATYYHALSELGNVEGDEMVALVIIAIEDQPT